MALTDHDPFLHAPPPSLSVYREKVLESDAYVRRFVILSDIHGLWEKITDKIPKGDVLIISGDLTIGVGTDLDKGRAELNRLNEWLKTLSFEKNKILLIAGNNDTFIKLLGYEETAKLLSNGIYLEDALCEIDEIKIFLSPISAPYNTLSRNCAFQIQGKPLKQKLDNWSSTYKRGDIDILVTHGPPYGHMDVKWDFSHVGCKELRHFVDTLQPTFHVFGHVHECYGFERTKETTFINASTSNMVTWPVHKPVVFDVFKSKNTKEQTTQQTDLPEEQTTFIALNQYMTQRKKRTSENNTTQQK